MRLPKRIAAWIAGSLVLALLAWAFWPRPVAVETGAVTRGPLEVTVGGEGETRVRDRYVVSAPVAGLVPRITLDPGDPVERGQALAVVEPAVPPLLDVRSREEQVARVRSAEAMLDRAEARVAQAETALRLAERELARRRPLAAEGLIPVAELDAAEAEAASRMRELEAARSEARSARFDLERERATLMGVGTDPSARARTPAGRVEVRSPVAGRVLRVVQESAAVVPAGAPLVEVGDPRDLEVVVDLLSTDAVAVEPGAAARLEGWGGGAPLPARVRLVEPSGFTKVSALGVEEQRVNVVLDFAGPADGQAALGDGYRVDVRIVVWARPDVLQVPVGALFRDEDGWAAFVVEDGRARRRAVQVGHRGERAAEVLSGLTEGETVILYPGDRVEEGGRVTARR
ncbi:MAG TPA: HlyD family efflux transporter periplasmic adaptor subunit [Thermodesulfobacteriota bacterium]